MTVSVAAAGEDDLGDLLPLVRGHCDFYSAAPGDDALERLSRTLIADPVREGVQLPADDDRAQALYDRIGARRSEWLDYDLAVARGRPRQGRDP